MSRRWRQPLVLVGLLLVSSCGAQMSGGDGAAPAGSGPAAVLPFAEFLADLAAARYADYAGRPGTGVRSEQAFDAMRRYLLERYRNADVARSYAAAGAVFDCIRRGGPAAAAPTAPAAPVAASPCPGGTVPVRRITLAQLVRFASLRSFLDKGPGTAAEPPP